MTQYDHGDRFLMGMMVTMVVVLAGAFILRPLRMSVAVLTLAMVYAAMYAFGSVGLYVMETLK